MKRHFNNQGFTLIEMLIVIAILGILMALGVARIRPPEARLFANSLKAQVVQAKIEAIKRNRPVSVLWNSTARSFTTLVMTNEDSTALPCSTTSTTGMTTLTTQRVSEYPRVQATNVFTSSVTASAVVWYPNGLPRFCNGSSLPTTNSSIRLSDQRQTLYVRIAPAGRVEVVSAP
jgi:prepilin-type N-terminal cleavage/methylation domain-containing protein